MHLSEPFSCMCLWESFKRESGDKETNLSRGGRDGVQQSFKEREAQDI